MQAALVCQRNPFAPRRDREFRTATRRLKVSRVARQFGLDPKAAPVVCFVNGSPVLQRHWRRYRLRDGDICAFVKLPQGGGGGSNPMRLVLTLAVIALSWYVGGLGAAFLVDQGIIASTSAGFASGLISGGVALAGALLVNALIPPPKVAAPESARDLAAASPTYSLGAQGNQARIGQAIPVQYGRHIVYPDFGASPYSEFAGNEQFLYQLFCVGQGAYSIESIRIEDTPIASFQDVQYELVQPGGTVTLFPTNVVTSVEVSGQECLTGVALGPFVINAAGTTINAIALDMVASQGLYFIHESGALLPKEMDWLVEAQPINDAGLPTGPFFTLGGGPHSMVAASQTPQRESRRHDVPTGRYQVKITRTDVKDESGRAGHTLNWFAVRGYMPGSQNYGEVTMLAVRMRASNQLSGLTARRFNLIATRKLPTRVLGVWTAAVATTSIAWALADACLNDVYGAGLDPAQVSFSDLDYLDATWTARGDSFNGVYDQTMTFWEALTQIARAGRAVPVLQGGVVYFVRDQSGTLPTALFSMRNILQGSFNLRYLMHTEDTVDGLNVEYFDDQTWKPITTLAYLLGETGQQAGKLSLFGATNRSQAWREGMGMLASNRYRRKFATFSVELEGHLPFFGDLVRVQHDLPAWGQFGEVVSYDAGTRTVILDEPLEWASGQHYAGFRTATGAFSGPWACSQGATPATLVLALALDFVPYTGKAAERTQAVFGVGAAHSMLCRVIGIRPRSDERVEIAVVNEDARVHTADGGAAPPGPGWDLPPVPTVPSISGELLVVAGGSRTAPYVSVSWQAAAGADYYIVEHSLDGATWTRIGDVTSTHITFNVPAGQNWIRVAPVGKAQGPWISWTGTITGEVTTSAPPPAPTGLTATGLLTTIVLQWADPAYTVRPAYYEILRNTVNNSGTARVVGRIPYGPASIYEDAVGDTNLTYWYWLRLVNASVNPESPGPVSNAVSAATGFILGGDIGVGQVFANNVAGGAITETKIADNSISSPKIIANAIIAGKLATDAVLAANIAANQIISSKIAAGQITASKMAANSITAGNAAIADATITTAKIIDANVTTLKLANQTVTIPVSAFNPNTQGPLASGGTYSLLTCSITSSGAPIQVIASASLQLAGTSTIVFTVLRNGSQVYGGYVPGSNSQNYTAAFSDQPGAGNWTYEIQFGFGGPNFGTANNCSILLLETKR